MRLRKELPSEIVSRAPSGGEELIVFLEGTAELSTRGETKTVHAPASALTPAHSRHSIKNKSEVPLEYVYVYVMASDAA